MADYSQNAQQHIANQEGGTAPGPGYVWNKQFKQWVPPGYYMDNASGMTIPNGQKYDAESGGYVTPPPAEPTDTYATAPDADQGSQSPLGDAGMNSIPTIEDIGAPVQGAAQTRTGQTNDIVDRYGNVKLDTTEADQARATQNEALGMQRDIYNKLAAYDPNAAADANAKRATSQTLAVARSAPGGAGARQAAMFQAIQQAPAIQSAAANDAVNQQRQNTQLMAQTAGQFADVAGGTRAQDLQQAQAETNTGLEVAQGISQALGRDMTLTSDEAKFLSQAKLALENLKLDWSQFSEQERAARAQEALRKAGLEQQWKQFKQSQEVGFLDVVGALTGTAKSAVGTYAAGKQSGLW
jgi:hypothetical protein